MPTSLAERTLAATLLTAASLLLAGGPAAAEPARGTDPGWVVSNYLDHRLYGAAVADYPYVCAPDREWSPTGVVEHDGPPFAHEQDLVLDIRSYDPSSIHFYQARNQNYFVVVVDVSGYERTESRSFVLAPGTEGYCIGQLA
ncbi:hypothetical protein [Antrihabitans spumae]|uniref:Secreted protein n=1 Tax=Antrihabitans spumae TaxID=3373370 RepID=A0ABW7K1C9_9NOCA